MLHILLVENIKKNSENYNFSTKINIIKCFESCEWWASLIIIVLYSLPATSLTCYWEMNHDKKDADVVKQSTLDLVFKEYIVNMYVNLIINFSNYMYILPY